eukprot:4230035-Alexandrium_andersonii.AAC.1
MRAARAACIQRFKQTLSSLWRPSSARATAHSYTPPHNAFAAPCVGRAFWGCSRRAESPGPRRQDAPSDLRRARMAGPGVSR